MTVIPQDFADAIEFVANPRIKLPPPETDNLKLVY